MFAPFHSLAAIAMQGAPLDSSSPPVSLGDPVAPILLVLVLIIVGAALGGRLTQRLGQAAVLGELLIGVVFGNAGYFLHQPTVTIIREGTNISKVADEALTHSMNLGQAARKILPASAHNERIAQILDTPEGVQAVSVYSFIDQVSRISIIVLLFLVGLETSPEEMQRIGVPATLVSVLGVVFSLCFGVILSMLLLPGDNFVQHVFIGGILTATSVGITARVLRDLRQMDRTESKIILGAAIIDDVLGLLVLVIVTGLVTGNAVHIETVAWITSKAVLFLVGAILIGLQITPMILKRLPPLESPDAKFLFGMIFAFSLSWLATLAGLSTIVGAFAAGLILGSLFEKEFEGFSIRGMLSPIESLIVPVFFVLIGLQVKLEIFTAPVVLLAVLLTLAAILGKVLAGFGASPKLNRLGIGIGMMPRGEVGLIFAGIGRTLGIVSDQVFGAVVVMVILTTLLTPPLLKMRLGISNKAAISPPLVSEDVPH